MADTTMTISVDRDGMDALSTELRDRLGVEEGGEIVLVDAKDGILLMTRRAFVDYALDRLGEGLPDDVTLEDLIESGRDLREELILEHYRIRPSVRIGDDGVLAIPPRFHDVLGVGTGQTLVSLTTSLGFLVMTPEAFLDCPADRLGDRSRRDVTREDLVVSGRARRREMLDELFEDDVS